MARFDIKVKSELVAGRFNAYLQELWAIDPTISFSALVRAEAAAVMVAALSRTKAANVAKIRAAVKDREWVTFGGKRYKLGERSGEGWRLPDTTWAQIEAYRQQRANIKLAARGLSKQTWLHLARALRPVLNAIPAYVAAANFKGQQYPQDVSTTEGSTPAGYILTLLNSSPVVQYAGGEWALLGAMQGRISYFRRNLQHRAFETLESRARKYPGIWVTESAAA
jgi:hypothetical protein